MQVPDISDATGVAEVMFGLTGFVVLDTEECEAERESAVVPAPPHACERRIPRREESRHTLGSSKRPAVCSVTPATRRRNPVQELPDLPDANNLSF